MCTHPTRDCCRQSADQSDAGFCQQCGSSILRCSSFPTCGGLLNPEDVCPSCFAPELKLVSQSEGISLGQSALLQLELMNQSKERTLIVKQVWIRIASGDWSPVHLSWDRLEKGQAKSVRYSTPPLETTGELGAEIVLVLAVQHGFREETFAFNASFSLFVENEQNVVVQQNIHYAADAPQTGATIYAPVRVQSDSNRGRNQNSAENRVLQLQRANRYETQFGVRSSKHPQVGPKTRVDFEDIPAGEQWSIPQFGQRRSQLIFGRSRARHQGGTNDFRLLFFNPDGSVDENSSLQISREHFCLYSDNGLLRLRALADRGVLCDGKPVLPAQTPSIQNGSKIEMKVQNLKITLTVNFHCSNNRVSRILIRRN